MLWQRSARPLVIPPVAPVPDAEALRRAVLQASWQRGRWVARRRVALRWALWASTRYVMPVLAVSGLAGWLWLGVLPGGNMPWLQDGNRQGPVTPAPVVVAAPPAETAAPDTPTESPPATAEYNPEGEEMPWPLSLELETRWAAAPPAQPQGQPPRATEPDSEPSPPLKPENWLHSKEP